MADNIDVTPGTGATVSAEEIAGKLFQRIKLIDSSVGSTAPIGVGLNPLIVSLGDTGGLALETGGNLAAAKVDLDTLVTGTALEDSASANADRGYKILAVRQDTPADTGADGDYEFIKQSSGRQWVSAKVDTALPAGTNNIGDVDVLTVPVDPFGVNADAASATGSISAKLRFIAATGIPVTGTVVVSNAGTFLVQENGTWIQVDDAAFTPATSKIAMAGFLADETSTDSVNEGDGGAARITLDRKQIVSTYAHGAGGFTPVTGSIGATKTDLGTANTPGTVGGWYIYNPNATVAYVQFFNAQASAVTLGTTAPYYSLGIPPTSAANIPATMPGIDHPTAISIAITTTRAGSTGPASTVDYNIFIKQ